MSRQRRRKHSGDAANLFIRAILGEASWFLGGLTDEEWQRTMDYFGGRCAYADEPLVVGEIDHCRANEHERVWATPVRQRAACYQGSERGKAREALCGFCARSPTAVEDRHLRARSWIQPSRKIARRFEGLLQITVRTHQ